MMRTTTTNTAACAKPRPGTAATEFAILVPLLLMIALACCDFGRVADARMVLTNAARTGAELGASQGFTDYTRGAWEAQVRAAVVDEMENFSGFQEAELDVNLTTSVGPNDVVQVAVSVAHPFRTVIAWPALPQVTLLQEQIHFRQFR